MSNAFEFGPVRANVPLVKIIANKYERRRLHIFDNERVFRLCRDLQVTLCSLCARAGMFKQKYNADQDLIRLELDTAAIKSAMRDNRWPVPAALHFEILEKEAALKNGQGALVPTSSLIDAKILNGTLGNNCHG